MPRGAVSVAAGTAFANPQKEPAMNADQRLGSTVRYAVALAGQPVRLAAVAAPRGLDLPYTCTLGDPGCHRDVLLDLANPPHSMYAATGRAMGLTLQRPWGLTAAGSGNIERQDDREPNLVDPLPWTSADLRGS